MPQDEKRELPNMTATEVQNAKQPPFSVHGTIADMVDREIAALEALGYLIQPFPDEMLLRTIDSNAVAKADKRGTE